MDEYTVHCGGLITFVVCRIYLRVSFPQIQHKFYKHVNKWNVATTNIKKITNLIIIINMIKIIKIQCSFYVRVCVC